MKILQTNSFKRTTKKLHPLRKKQLDKAVKKILEQPDIGKRKTGDLINVRVYKYKHKEQQNLLAYSVEEHSLTLLALGSHENFYRDLKRQIK